jgi:hypothetical protein
MSLAAEETAEGLIRRLGSTRRKNNTSPAVDYLMVMNLLATVLDSEHSPAVCPTCSASSI